MSGQLLRIATFNLESLDDKELSARVAAARTLSSAGGYPLSSRGERPANSTRPRAATFCTVALISETCYAGYELISTLTVEGHPADRHNLVILSRDFARRVWAELFAAKDERNAPSGSRRAYAANAEANRNGLLEPTTVPGSVVTSRQPGGESSSNAAELASSPHA